MTLWWLVYPLLGTFAGFIAGLFGISGGMMIVPFMVMLFSAQGFSHEQILHLALGTAMASIAFTSIASMHVHNSHGAVRWDIVKPMAPGMVLGVLCGSMFIGIVPTKPLAVIFTLVVSYISIQMIAEFTPKTHRKLPRPFILFLVGFAAGAISSLVAAGGGFLTIPFMLMCNVPIYEAVGTSATLGLPVAIAGMIGYIIAGWGAENLPPFAFSFIYLPALIGIAAFSTVMASFGAKVTHSLPLKPLKRAFGGFLAALAAKMLYSIFA